MSVKVDAEQLTAANCPDADGWHVGWWRFVIKARGRVLYREDGNHPTRAEAVEVGKRVVRHVRRHVGPGYVRTFFEDRMEVTK